MSGESWSWPELRPWTEPIGHTEQVIIVAATGGAKSTLAASMTLPVGSLVGIDGKETWTLPRARLVNLPPWGEEGANRRAFDAALGDALRWRTGRGETNRVILRPYVLDVESLPAHDAIFAAIYRQGSRLVLIDEITSTGATARTAPQWLRAISARGRTRGLGLWTLTQRPYALVPTILKANATYLIVGPLEPEEVADIPRPGIDLATTIPRKSGRFLLYVAGEREPYRLYVPIPPALHGWSAP